MPSITALATSFTSARVGKGRAGHRLEHLRRGDHGFPGHVAEADDLLLDERHPARGNLNAEVAAGDHHCVGNRDDAGEVVERDRSLDLRHEVRPGAALGQAGAHGFDVFGTPHERQAHEIGLDLDRHVERDGVGFGERLDVTFGARHVHALA